MPADQSQNLKSPRPKMRAVADASRETSRRPSVSSMTLRLGVLFGLTLLLTLALYPNLVLPKKTYRLGDVAERDIKASKEFFVEDRDATEEKRRRAIDSVLTIYDHDAGLARDIIARVDTAFSDMRDVIASHREAAGDASVAEDTPQTLYETIMARKDTFEAQLGIDVSNGAYRLLEKEAFSKTISDLIVKIVAEIMENGVVANKELLLQESEKGITLRELQSKTERVPGNLRQFYGLDQAKTMVRVIGQPLVKDLNYNLINLVVDFSQRLIQPNITLNRSATEENKLRVAAEIKPVMYKIKSGEMLLREGERVTDIQLIKLNALRATEKNRRMVSTSIGAALLLMGLFVMAYLLHIRPDNRLGRDRDRNLLFLASSLLMFFFMALISAGLAEAITQNSPYALTAASVYYGIPLSAGAMIICLFTGIEMALPFALVLSACTAILFHNRFDIFLYFLINSAMAAYWIQDCRERKEFITAGAKIGLLNIFLVSAVGVYTGDITGIKLLWDWGFAILGGIGASIVTVGLTPIVEMVFGYTTDITLMERANLDRPILRRLMLEAPGTYHHSVIVGTMVEAAASEIGANPLLAKVCGYYHDIGKLRKPLYFIENQSNGRNPHDKLAPSMSSLILISHIKDGVEFAKEHKLGREIIDTIRQHHGTSRITYFYEKARQLKGTETADLEGFRYPGPRPQTKEAGLVMLADITEAASRTLANPTPSRIQGLVQNLINKVFSDGQLDNCELTLKDLHNIAKSFNKILNGIHHHRIEYTENPPAAREKGKNGGFHRQPSKSASDSGGDDTEPGKGHLRRLGQS